MNEEIAERISTLIDDKNYNAIKKELCDIYPTDAAEIISKIEAEKRHLVFRLLSKTIAAETFVEMDSDMQLELLKAFTDQELRSIIDELYLDDTVDLIEEMPSNVVKKILASTDAETRKKINELLSYPEDSAGSIMTVELVELKAGMTLTEALEKIRTTGFDKETIYTCYVTDSNRRLIGVTSVREILLSKETYIKDIMMTSVIKVNTHDDKEEVTEKLREYGLIALPVTDNEDRLVGIVTFDDAMDVISEENEEDIQIMAAITPSDTPYLKQSVTKIWLSRIPWLLLLMISATLTGSIILSFESSLAVLPALTAFIPMIMGTGGNSGSQASVSVTRAISHGEIVFSDIFRVIWKELRISVLCAITLAVANFAKIILWDMLLMKSDGVTVTVAAIVSLTLAFTIIAAKIIGASLPIIASKLKLDPAVMASPLITTLVDAVSLLVYLATANALLAQI